MGGSTSQAAIADGGKQKDRIVVCSQSAGNLPKVWYIVYIAKRKYVNRGSSNNLKFGEEVWV